MSKSNKATFLTIYWWFIENGDTFFKFTK